MARRRPFALTPHVPLRSAEERDAIWKGYERLVAYAAGNRQVRVVTSEDIVAMVEPPSRPDATEVARLRPSPPPSPALPRRRRVNWLADPSVEQVIAYVRRRKETFEAMGAGPVTDLNGNFDLTDPSPLAASGIRSLTAFKNRFTQKRSFRFYVQPWVPGAGAGPLVDEVSWSRHDAQRKAVYLPGAGPSPTRFHDRLRDRVWASLTNALVRWRPDAVSTWYFVGHVDSFQPRSGRGRPGTYADSDDYRRALGTWEAVLENVFDPLVAKGYIQWSTASQMRKAYEAQEAQ